jgi:hypothetical protein
MSIFRSEDMFLYKIVMAKDNEKAIMSILGDRKIAHFINMNQKEQVFKLPYVDLIRRCDESERKVNYLIDRCKITNIQLTPAESPEELHQLTKDFAASKR